MKEKIKTQKGFIKIPLLIIVIASIVIISVGTYGGFEYHKTSKLVKEANYFIEEEKYEEAIEKLNLAQGSWFVKNLGIKKQEIINKQEEVKKLTEDLSKYTQGLDEFGKGNYRKAIDLLSELSEQSFYYQKAQTKIEETKRKIVEGELAEETIKRAKEEAARKAKEKELAEKEAEEKRLSADRDGDTLTLREEMALGTSDLDQDSDDDIIPDNLDSHPTGGGRYIAQHFEWSYEGQNWTWAVSIHSDWYDFYKNIPRTPHGIDYVTYYDSYIQSIAKMLLKEAEKYGYCKPCFAVAFIQGLPYIEDFMMGYDDYPKYPIETLIERTGDCEDTSYLAASIIEAMGKDIALVKLPGHMAISVWGDPDWPGTYYKLNGRRYYYYETTAKGWWFGEIPDEFRHTPATLIEIPSGKTTRIYPKYQIACKPSLLFFGYYYDGTNYYRDSQCRNLTTCLYYGSDMYYNYVREEFYWDSWCTQKITPECYKSIYYPGYFYDGWNWYYDSRCTQIAYPSY